jgi:lipopolysaccharide export system protein LptC
MATTSLQNQNTGGPDGNGHALEFWEPRRALTLDAARRHSVFVRQARYGLIGFAVLLAGMLAWYFIQAPKTPPPLDNPEETVRMVNPVYKGRTSDGLPYRLTASDATRFIQNDDEVKLTNPVLNFLRTDGVAESLILASSGLYNSKTQVLELRQDVNLDTDNGYICNTGHARVFVKGKRIEGDEPIACSGNFGTAGGNAYEINDNYTEFVFKNGMTAQLIPAETEDLLEPDTELRGPQE